MTKMGTITNTRRIEEAVSYIKNWLERLEISGLSIDTRYDARLNIAMLRFTYQGKNYQYTCNTQKNCRLNLWAIAYAMESKVRNHLRQVEPFETAISPYLMIGASDEAISQGYQQEAPKVSDNELTRAFAILGISPLSSNKELSEHYKKMAKSFHPDLAGSELAKKVFEEKFTEINNAWQIIKKSREIT